MDLFFILFTIIIDYVLTVSTYLSRFCRVVLD